MFSTLSRTRVAGSLVCAALAAAIMAPGASAQDRPWADAHDALSAPAEPSISYDDLRSPDARDTTQAASPGEDRRSPDARDIPAPAFESEPIADVPAAPSGFDWISAAIGAAAGTGMLLVLMAFLGSGGLTGRRQRTA
jgi:hypothetical protein